MNFHNIEPRQRGVPVIVCAANRISGTRLILGARHYDTMMQLQIEDLLNSGLISSDEVGNAEQGFVDQHGRFYTREEAYHIAEKNQQIHYQDTGSLKGQLFSEHLY